MRLWSFHPKYLDSRGLVALWREALLAQAVIAGKTARYRRHPQLVRFRAQSSPLSFMAEYLRAVHAESVARGYRFDRRRIGRRRAPGQIDVPQGQIDFEWRHLMDKLAKRAPDLHEELLAVTSPHRIRCFAWSPAALPAGRNRRARSALTRGESRYSATSSSRWMQSGKSKQVEPGAVTRDCSR